MNSRSTFSIEDYLANHQPYLKRMAEENGMAVIDYENMFRFILENIVRSLPISCELEFPAGSGIYYRRLSLDRFQLRIDKDTSRRWLLRQG